MRGSEHTRLVQILQRFLTVRNLANLIEHPIMCLQLLTFQRLICWPNMGRFSQGSSGPKDTHCQVSSSCLQIEMLYFGVQGLTFFNRGKQPILSLVPRNSRQAGIKNRERGPDLQEKLPGIPESVQKFAAAEGLTGKLPPSSNPCADAGALCWAVQFTSARKMGFALLIFCQHSWIYEAQDPEVTG